MTKGIHEIEFETIQVPLLHGLGIQFDQVLANRWKAGVEHRRLQPFLAAQNAAGEALVGRTVVADERHRIPQDHGHAQGMRGRDIGGHRGDAFWQPVAAIRVATTAIECLPAIVDDHRVAAKLLGDAALLQHPRHLKHLMETVPRRIHRTPTDIRHRQRYIALRPPDGDVMERPVKGDFAPIEPDLDRDLGRGRMRRGKHHDGAVQLGRFLDDAEGHHGGMQSVTAGDGEAIVITLTKGTDHRRLRGRPGLIVATGPTRHQTLVAITAAAPDAMDVDYRTTEDDFLAWWHRCLRRREAHGDHRDARTLVAQRQLADKRAALAAYGQRQAQNQQVVANGFGDDAHTKNLSR